MKMSHYVLLAVAYYGCAFSDATDTTDPGAADTPVAADGLVRVVPEWEMHGDTLTVLYPPEARAIHPVQLELVRALATTGTVALLA